MDQDGAIEALGSPPTDREADWLCPGEIAGQMVGGLSRCWQVPEKGVASGLTPQAPDEVSQSEVAARVGAAAVERH